MLNIILAYLFGIFAILAVVNFVLILVNLQHEHALQLQIMDQNHQIDVMDSPITYMITYITSPKIDNEDNDQNNNEINAPENNNVIHSLVNRAKISIITARPSQIVQKIKELIDINWNTETFHLIDRKEF